MSHIPTYKYLISQHPGQSGFQNKLRRDHLGWGVISLPDSKACSAVQMKKHLSLFNVWLPPQLCHHCKSLTFAFCLCTETPHENVAFDLGCAKKSIWQYITVFIFLIPVLYCDPCTVIRIIAWSPCQNWNSVTHKNTNALYLHTFSFSVSSSSARQLLNFISCFYIMAATSVCLGIYWKGNFELNCFDSKCLLNYQYKVIYYADCTLQLVFQLCFYILS